MRRAFRAAAALLAGLLFPPAGQPFQRICTSMTDQGFSSDFFDDAEDVRTYARKRVSEFISRQYPDINALDARKRNAIVDDCTEHVTESVLKKIDAGEPIDLLSLTSILVREYLTRHGFKASALAESVPRKSRTRARVCNGRSGDRGQRGVGVHSTERRRASLLPPCRALVRVDGQRVANERDGGRTSANSRTDARNVGWRDGQGSGKCQ